MKKEKKRTKEEEERIKRAVERRQEGDKRRRQRGTSPLDIILGGIEQHEKEEGMAPMAPRSSSLNNNSSKLVKETKSSRLRKSRASEMIGMVEHGGVGMDEDVDEDVDEGVDEGVDGSVDGSGAVATTLGKWNLHIDPNNNQVKMSRVGGGGGSGGGGGRYVEPSLLAPPEVREKKWNSFHHIKRTSITSTPRSGATADDDLGYSSHRQSFQTTKKEKINIKRSMTNQSKTVARSTSAAAARGGGRTTRLRVGSQSARVATRIRPRETKASTLRRMSHAYHAHELVSRKSNDKKVVVPWISGNRRNTIVGTLIFL